MEVVVRPFGEIGALPLDGEVVQLSSAVALALAVFEIQRRARPPPR